MTIDEKGPLQHIRRNCPSRQFRKFAHIGTAPACQGGRLADWWPHLRPKPISSDGGWCVSLYPWGDRLTRDFYAKADAIAFANELHSLDVPWEHIRGLDIGSDEYRMYVALIMSLISDCDADGLLMPIEPNVEASPVKPRKSGKLPLLRHQRRPPDNADE